ncbi:MAG: class I SAM-dependent methyltransferase [Kofleriaceae bacterium]
MSTRRYQLRKDAVVIVEGGHPWLFRDQMSSAAEVFGDGDWLRLVDGTNRVVGFGIFEAEGAIAIRVLRLGAAPPDAAWVRGQLAAALARRTALATRTDAIRLVNGESDGLAAVVIDRFADTLVASSYSAGSDALARYAAQVLAAVARGQLELAVGERAADDNAAITQPIEIVRDAIGSGWHSTHQDLDVGSTMPIAVARPAAIRARTEPPVEHVGDVGAAIGAATNVILRPARRRQGPPQPQRVMCGSAPALVAIHEDGRPLAVDLEGGHKTGTYLDLRALRRTLAEAPLAGARVLNLFSYTGMLGAAVERAGAASITQVDQSARALQFAAAHHVADPTKHQLLVADVFDWFPALADTEQYDLVIVDPPSMTSKAAQIPNVLAAYRKLYRTAARHTVPNGLVVAACCTSRIDRDLFKRTVREALGPGFTLERDLPPEPDHPVGFAQADYLKIGFWRRR